MPVADIEWTIKSLRGRIEGYNRARRYYDGNHDLTFATEKFRNTFGPLFREFADNLCDSVVDALADRLTISSWDGDAAQAAEKLWKDPSLAVPRYMRQVHREAARTGDAYMIVWPDADGQVRFWPHDADQVTVEYDDEDDPRRIVRAGKLWIDNDGFGRCTLYYEDHIERYVTHNKCVESGQVPDKQSAWDAKGADVANQYDVVPVFHFGNDADVGDFGVSELRDVFALQNALNKSVCDMLVAMEFVAMPQRYATGLQIEVDEDTGKPKNPPFTPGVDRIWTAGEGVTFGEFRQADLRPFIEVQDAFRLECARVSATPPHYLGLLDKVPTGEGLKVIEGRFIRKITNRQVDFGVVWATLMAFAVTVDGGSAEPDLLPVWDNPAPHNPLLDAETQLVKQQVGVSKQRSLKELGYSDEEIAEMLQQALDEAHAFGQVQADAGNATGQPGVDPSGRPTPFNRNGSPGQASTPAPIQQQQGKIPVPKPRVSWADYQEAS